MRVTFIVDARAVPQGSKRYIGNGRMIEQAGAALYLYRNTVRSIAQQSITTPTTHPVSVSIRFVFQRPKKHYKNGMLSTDAPKYPYPAKRGDIDKLSRAALDALTGVAYQDDAQVIHLEAKVEYGDDNKSYFVIHDEFAGI